MALDVFDEDKLTWRRMTIIGGLFLAAVILSGLLLMIFYGSF